MTGALDATDLESLGDAVQESLRGVIDPELGENVVDLELIYFVAVDDAGTAHVVMTTTTPGCPAVGYLKDGVARAASAVPSVATAEVAVTYDPPWTPEKMYGSAKEQRPPKKHRFWWPW